MTSGAPLRSAEIIAVGSELLGADRVDSNSLFLSERLESLGIALRAKSVVGDSREHLADDILAGPRARRSRHADRRPRSNS